MMLTDFEARKVQQLATAQHAFTAPRPGPTLATDIGREIKPVLIAEAPYEHS